MDQYAKQVHTDELIPSGHLHFQSLPNTCIAKIFGY